MWEIVSLLHSIEKRASIGPIFNTAINILKQIKRRKISDNKSLSWSRLYCSNTDIRNAENTVARYNDYIMNVKSICKEHL